MDHFKRHTCLSHVFSVWFLFICFVTVHLIQTPLAKVLPEEEIASPEWYVFGQEAQAGMGCQHRRVLGLFPGLPCHQAERLAVLMAGSSCNTQQHMETASGPSIWTPAHVPGWLTATDLIPEDTKALCKQNLQSFSMHLCRDWVYSKSQGTSVLPQKCFSILRVGHCVLLSFGSFLSSFLFFPVSLMKSSHLGTYRHHSPRQGAHFSLSTLDLFSLALLCFCCAWFMTHKDISSNPTVSVGPNLELKDLPSWMPWYWIPQFGRNLSLFFFPLILHFLNLDFF